jgi:hypothetical protein
MNKNLIFWLLLMVPIGPVFLQSDFSDLATFQDSQEFFRDRGKTIITDPAISKRCYQMIEKRQEKITIKQKVRALIERNRYLQKMTPQNKKNAKDRLLINMRNLENEQKLIDFKIQNLEEEVIRKGCPGINLKNE